MSTQRIAALLLALVLAPVLAGCQPSTPAFHSTDLSATDGSIGSELSLNDHTGKARTLKDFMGKVVVVFFGYTQCPDVCPTNMSTLRDVMSQLGPEAAKVQVLFVSVDPDRDTPELLAQYVPAFHPDFLGLVGTTEQTAKAAKDFRIFYQRHGKAGERNYTVDHSTGSYVFDANGNLRLYVRHGETATNIADDLRRLLRGE